ncbi:zinc finger, CCHC-type containing protein [Tanacetum coccineum]
MVAAAMKHMALNFTKLDKFEGVDFRRWQKKMHFLLSSMSVVYVLTTPILEDCENATMETTQEEGQKFLVSNFINYKMTDSRPVMEQYNELLGILGRFTQHKMNMDKAIQVSCIIDKLLPSWKDFKHTLKHLKEELTLIELGSHLHIKESLRVQDSDKPKGNNVAGPLIVNMVEHNNFSRKPGHLKKDCKGGKVCNKANGSGTNGSVDGSTNSLKTFMSTSKLNDSILWHARLGHVHFKRMQDMSKDGFIPNFDMDTEKLIYVITPSLRNKKYFVTFIDDASRTESRVLGAVVRLPDPKLKTLGERGIECIFVGYAKHSKAFRFYVIEPNKSVLINSIIESMDAIFDENRFYSVPKPSLRIPNGTEDIGTKDEVSDQHSYCFNVEDDPKTFDEAMKSKDVAFWKEAINDEMDFIIGNNSWVLADLSPGFKPLGCKWVFRRKLKVDGTIKKFKVRLVIQGFRQKSGIDYFDTYVPVARISTIRLLITMALIHNLIIHQMDVKIAFLNVSTPMDTSEKLMPNNGEVVSQLEYSRVIGCLMYAMTYTRPGIAFAVGKLSRYTSNPSTQHWQAIQRVLKYLKKTIYTGYPSVLEGYTDASWISNVEDNLSTSGWVFLLGGGAISWASKKQTCITGSIMEYEFVALAAAGKEAECAATLAKAYSQMYNGKSRHLGVRYSMIRDLITNRVISIEFVRSQQNLVDHLTKGLARDLFIKSVEGMSLKSN